MKKYSSGSFIDAALRVYGSEADTITSFPASIIADGENASAIIYGNMTQTGTPTPASPIYPSECGELVSSNYTIPVISGGVTTSINLNSVQSDRKIKKIALTGAEEVYSESNLYNIRLYSPNMVLSSWGISYCSHFQAASDYTECNTNSGFFGLSIRTTTTLIWFNKSDFSTIEDFKTFLLNQYNNGTPVTVWFVLETPTIEILNEPLRKIGDYADSVAAAAIPTTAGSQSFNIDTTLKPSSVSLTYTGWHTHSDKQYSGGSWGQVTSNAKVLRRKRATKSKT